MAGPWSCKCSIKRVKMNVENMIFLLLATEGTRSIYIRKP